MKRHAITVLLLLTATVALGQIHGAPASVTSLGFSQHRVPASVTSLGPNGFRPSAGAGSGFGFGNHPRFFVRDNNFRQRRFSFSAYPVLVPVYSYPLSYATYPSYLNYDANAVDDYVVQPYAADDHRGATIYERNYDPTRSLADDAARYGEHYLDSREGQRSQADGRRESDVRVIPGPKAPASQAAAEPASQEPATVLIFKNGDRMEVHNYAIVGEMVWVLSGATSHKYALTELDVQKTVKENDERGLEFKLPRHG